MEIFELRVCGHTGRARVHEGSAGAHTCVHEHTHMGHRGCKRGHAGVRGCAWPDTGAPGDTHGGPRGAHECTRLRAVAQMISEQRQDAFSCK